MESKKRILTGTNATAVVVLTLVGAILLNAIMSQYPVVVDLTEDKIYTLSDASIDAVASLEEPVQVKVFISPDMPPPFHTLSQQLSDLLADYAAHSGGKLDYQIIQPSSEDAAAEEAAAGYGIQKVAIGQQSEDEVSLRAVYKGVAFVKGDQTEVIEDLQTTGNPEYDNFEYEFTKALMNLSDVEPRKVAFLAGFGGAAAGPQFVSSIQPVFEQLYGKLIEVSTVDLSAPGATIPEDVDALVILYVTEPVSEHAKFAIDQFVQRGGSVGWYQSATAPDEQIMRQLMQQMGPGAQMPDIRKIVDSGLVDLFSAYGLQYNADLVLDRKNALALGYVMTQQGLARVSHPATFLMSDIDQSLPFTRNVPAIAMPAPSSITIRPEVAENEALEVYEIAQTADVAVRRPTPPTSLNYQELVEPTPEEQPGPFVVAAAVQGDVASYYADRPLPEGVTEDKLVKDAVPSRVLVVGSGEFFQPRPNLGFNEQLAGMGGQFLLSSIEWLVQDNALTQIRGKNMPRLIGEVDRSMQRRIQFINIALVPAMFIMIGYLVLLARRRRKRTFEL